MQSRAPKCNAFWTALIPSHGHSLWDGPHSWQGFPLPIFRLAIERKQLHVEEARRKGPPRKKKNTLRHRKCSKWVSNENKSTDAQQSLKGGGNQGAKWKEQGQPGSNGANVTFKKVDISLLYIIIIIMYFANAFAK